MSIPESNIFIPGAALPHVIVPFPTEITVHLGLPDDENALNVTVPFIDYIKNVASSELYPTWPEEALKANIHAIVSTAMNRVFTEWYRGRGYNFDITNSIQFDQAYVHDRGIFSNISDISNESFDQYIVREGHIEPLFAAFCDGREVRCKGMHQWGTVDLANQGYTAIEILRYYYGDDVTIVDGSFPTLQTATYPGTPLELGDSGITVFRMQHSLNRISDNYPGIPRINVTGYFNESTENTVREFQKVFNLPATGIVDEDTWYMIRRIYISVTRLYELVSEGLIANDLIQLYSTVLLEGGNRPVIGLLQFFLNVLSASLPSVPAVNITGYFGPETTASVIGFQTAMNLPPSGIVDQITWNTIYRTVYDILVNLTPEEIFIPNIKFMGLEYREGMGAIYPGILILELMLAYLSTKLPQIPSIVAEGIFDSATTAAVIAFQNLYELEPTGTVNEATWNKIVDVYHNMRYGVGTSTQ
jgi:peptidoglycan hydrolase-like protein with peptidoglycan-binding domain